MKRDIDIEQVSDGKRYTSNDMVRLGCDDCSGCSDCCRGMGSSILLDPYDAYRLMKGLGYIADFFLKEIFAHNNIPLVLDFCRILKQYPCHIPQIRFSLSFFG